MTHSLTNLLPLSALLRNASGIAAPVINSLCCAAAGITKALSATAGVLIPHKKLREAAQVGASLNAKNRPPAQPVVGYKRSTKNSGCEIHRGTQHKQNQHKIIEPGQLPAKDAA